MFANYEKRQFGNEKIWIARYKNLNNLLHWHTESEIIWVNKGSAEIIIDKKSYFAEKGSTYYICSEIPHRIITEENSIITVFQVDISLLNEFNQLSIKSHLLSNDYDIETYYRLIKKNLSKKRAFYYVSANCLMRSLVAEIFTKEPTEKHVNTDSVVKSILSFMEQNFQSITFEETAKHFAYSEAYFSRYFKNATGLTFTSYLNYIKINHSLHLIHNSTKAITQIAIDCGFNSIRHFNRIFKEITGYSPKNIPENYPVAPIFVSHSKFFDPTLSSSIILE